MGQRGENTWAGAGLGRRMTRLPPRRPPMCPVCEGTSLRPSRAFSRGGRPVWECDGCGVAFFWPLPTVPDVAPQYDWSEYGQNVFERDRSAYDARVRMLGDLLDEAGLAPHGSRTMVDVGCSLGHFIEAARAKGWDPVGIELDPETAHRTADRLNVPVRAGSGVDQLARLGTFGLIVMSHWLEHVPNPAEAIQVAGQHLAPGGRILLRVPNAQSRVARTVGVGWAWFLPGVHLFYFGPPSIQALAHRSGLRVTYLRTWRGDADPEPVELAVGVGRALIPTNLRRFARNHRLGPKLEHLRPGRTARPGGAQPISARSAPSRHDTGSPELVAVLERTSVPIPS
jgi:SAM-dependent methyltransferase